MWIFYTALVLFILLTGYFFIFPLSKKRPVLIKRGGLIIYGVILLAALFPLLEMLYFTIGAGVIIFISLFRLWFVYGITEIMISEALEKAASATRTPLEKNNGNYIIDNKLRVALHKILGKVHLVSFKKVGKSKKAKLTVVVFKKFIQNYFI